MVLLTCFVTIPALPRVVTISSTTTTIAELAYASTNTNYFGVTSCSLSTCDPSSWAKCTIAPSISGKAYSITPMVTLSQWSTLPSQTYLYADVYKCDPIPAASINAGNWKVACPSLPASSMGRGYQTINFVAPTGADVSIAGYMFYMTSAKTTPVYVINTALAKTTMVPETIVFYTATTSSTRTLPVSTSLVQIATGTRTWTCTTTVKVTASTTTTPPPAPLIVGTPKRLGGTASPVPTALLKLKERAVATPTIAHPDYTYPPYGSTTIYVNSISTSTCTHLIVSQFTLTPPPVTSTRLYEQFVYTTITVTPTVD
ncbi:hypothetical protein GQ53DRAFT_690021 [Thozetella sp. PMI_491]|nr:hypothetical protein GQ53DRAFT_690021 [Thozetella sp. PMI_491]